MNQASGARQKLRELREQKGWSREKLAEVAGTSYGQISKLESGERKMTEQWIGRMAEALGVTPRDFFADAAKRASPQSEQGFALPRTHNPDDTALPGNNFRRGPEFERDDSWRNKPMVPVLGTARGGSDGSFILNTGEPVDWVKRLPGVTGTKVYCIYLEGDSMEPRLDAGDPLLVDPVKKPVAGRDVVIQMKQREDGDEYRAFVKQLVSINSEYIEVRQFNPPKKWKIKQAEIHSIHVILDRREIY